MKKLALELKGYNVVAREVEGKLFVMVEHKPGEFIFPVLDQPQARELVTELKLDIQVD